MSTTENSPPNKPLFDPDVISQEEAEALQKEKKELYKRVGEAMANDPRFLAWEKAFRELVDAATERLEREEGAANDEPKSGS